jgi:uncharacterized RDD family membrane protein YckC
VGDRILAYLIDQLILMSYVFAIIVLYINAKMDIVWAWVVTLAGPILLYHLLFEIFMNGQTPGKRAIIVRDFQHLTAR